MELVHGAPLLSNDSLDGFTSAQIGATMEQIGRVLVFDMALYNEDRLCCPPLGWAGNTGNLMYSNKDKSVVAIDSGLPRRPPMRRRDGVMQALPDVVLSSMTSLDGAGTLLEAIINHTKGVPKAITECIAAEMEQAAGGLQRGIRHGVVRCEVLRSKFNDLKHKIDTAIQGFFNDMKTLGGLNNNLGGTIVMKKACAKGSREEMKSLVAEWNTRLQAEGAKIREACAQWEHENGQGFETGFLADTSYCLPSAYELKVRLEHFNERLTLLAHIGGEQAPIQILPHLYLGGVLAAQSTHTLRRLGITDIINVAAELTLEIGADGGFTMHEYAVHDLDDEPIDQCIDDTCTLINDVKSRDGAALVHCFEGRSRAATVVLAYLIKEEKMSLECALDTVQHAGGTPQPNDNFMQQLIQLETRQLGNATVNFKPRKPAALTCQVCGVKVGLSRASLAAHLKVRHGRWKEGSTPPGPHM